MPYICIIPYIFSLFEHLCRSRGAPGASAMRPGMPRRGTNGVSTSGVTANSRYFDRGTFWAPLVLTPFVRDQVPKARSPFGSEPSPEFMSYDQYDRQPSSRMQQGRRPAPGASDSYDHLLYYIIRLRFVIGLTIKWLLVITLIIVIVSNSSNNNTNNDNNDDDDDNDNNNNDDNIINNSDDNNYTYSRRATSTTGSRRTESSKAGAQRPAPERATRPLLALPSFDIVRDIAS